MMKNIPTEENILDAAKEEFLQYGYMEASMRRIDTAVAVEVGSYAYVFNTHYADHVIQMMNGVHNGGLPFGTKEAVVQRHLGDAAFPR